MEILRGKKTYIVSVLIAVATVALQLGYIDKGSFEAVIALLSALGLSTLRAGVTNG